MLGAILPMVFVTTVSYDFNIHIYIDYVPTFLTNDSIVAQYVRLIIAMETSDDVPKVFEFLVSEFIEINFSMKPEEFITQVCK